MGVAAGAQPAVQLLFPASTACTTVCDGQLLTVDPQAGRVVETHPLPSALALDRGNPYLTPDGGLLAWVGLPHPGAAPALGLFDQRTKTSAATSNTPFATSVGLIGNPVRIEIYATGATGPLAWSPSGTRQLQPMNCGPGSLPPRPVLVSADGRRVAYSCAAGTGIYDTEGGQLLRQAPFGIAALSPDGDSYYELVFDQPLRRYSVATGAVLAQLAAPKNHHTVTVDPRTGDVYLFRTRSIEVYDGETLQLERSEHDFPCSDYNNGHWVFDRFSPLAYVTASDSTQRYCIVDTASLTALLGVELPAAGRNPGLFVPAYRPAAPSTLGASVNQTAVSVTWGAGAPAQGATVRYLLEVGSAPGLSNIVGGLDVGLQTSFAANGVPPGTYYVRVRAGNYVGVSAPSNEVVVTVP